MAIFTSVLESPVINPPAQAPPAPVITTPITPFLVSVENTAILGIQGFPGFRLGTFSGVCPQDFSNIIGGKVIIKPIAIDVGLIFAPATVLVIIWNTFKTSDVQLIDVQVTNGINIVVNDLAVLDTIVKTDSLQFNYVISNQGPPTINARYDFEFDILTGPEPNQIVFNTIKGIRGIGLINEPLLDGYGQEYLFDTDIFKAEDGEESRSVLTNDPIPVRKTNGTVKLFSQREVAEVQNLISFAEEFTVFAPLWFDQSELTAPTDGISNRIFLDTENRDFNIDFNVLILRKKGCGVDRLFDIQKVTAIDPTYLDLEIAPKDGFEIGDRVIPVIVSTVDKSSRFIYRAQNQAIAELTFTEIR